MMEHMLQFFIWIPLVAFIISALVPSKNERLLSSVAAASVILHLAGLVIFIVRWIAMDYPTLAVKHLVLFKADTIEIFISFFFDMTTAAFALMGSLTALMVALFSRYYLHREAGFKRFFVTFVLFFLGYNIIVFSGNFETFFVGWEVLGICSFLLIAFYRDRYLPVKNSLKIISFYRLGDVCLVLAMWMSHHLWHENITFIKLSNDALVQEHMGTHQTLALLISLMILVAAAIKSAQVPFTSWLPRAMEGPTTSSAIFYGSLSVHLGVFVLLRTYPFWSHLPLMKTLVIALGIATALIATSIARIQSTVKTQIAYSSAAQIGIMMVEVALGFHVLALVHFAGNAFLRTYQLLISPSVMSYLIHHQFFHFTPRAPGKLSAQAKRVVYSLYVLGLKEWNFDTAMYRLIWRPFKSIGNGLGFLTHKIVWVLMAVLLAAGVYALYSGGEVPYYHVWPYAFASLALVLVLRAFSGRGHALQTWLLISISQLFISLAIATNKHFDLTQVALYLSGGFAASIVGYACLRKIEAIDNDISLDKYHGYAYERPRVALVFVLSCLGIVAFPITPAFIGFDVILTHVNADQLSLIVLAGLYFIFIELSALRIYARVFMGQHKKAHHAIAYRSS